MKLRTTTVLLASLLLTWGLGEASAQGPWPSLGWHSPIYYGYEYQLGNIPTPPYFAIHPPVYYGTRLSMSYGDSPFPHPVGTSPAENVCRRQSVSAPPVGAMITNPYVHTKKGRKDRKSDDEGDTLHIVANPYVVSDGTIEPQESLVLD